MYRGSGNNVYALNASTGALLWSYFLGDAEFSSPAVVNGVVYVDLAATILPGVFDFLGSDFARGFMVYFLMLCFEFVAKGP